MLERVLQLAVAHRWLIVLATAAVAAVGGWQLSRLPIDAVPDITNEQVQVNTACPALSPTEVEQQVTFPLETALAGIPGLAETRSLSRNGFSQITAVFDEGTDVYFARQQVKERLDAAGVAPGIEPTLGPVSTGLGEVYMYVVRYKHPDGKGAPPGRLGWQSDGSYLTPEGERLASDVERATYLRTVQDWVIRPQLRAVRDVAGVDSIGGYEKQYHVQPDPMRLVAFGLSFTDVAAALERNNASVGAGYVERHGEAVNVRVAGRLTDAAQIADVPVGVHEGVPIRVRDVATVGVGRQLRSGSASADGHEAVIGTALMLIGANSRTVAAAVDAKVAEVNRRLPVDVEAVAVLNRTKLVDATIRTVEHNLVEGAVLVVAVLLALLGNWRAAVVTACAIPLSMLATAIGMVQTRTSGNLMSLGAVDFGLIVDGAVIVVENSLRHLAERQHQLGRTLTPDERRQTVVASATEMVRPSVFGQAIIVTVYLPILLLSGTEGKMFRPMAATVIFALVAAFVLSMTFVPAMVAIVIRGRVSEGENWLVRGAKAAYAPAVRAAVRWRWAVAGGAVAVLAGAAVLFGRLGSEFIPTLDEKDLAISALRIPSTSLTQAQTMQFDLERALTERFPEVRVVFSKTGTAELASDPMPANASDTFVMLKPQGEWRSEAEIDKLIEGHGGRGEATTRKGKLVELIGLELATLPGNNYEFTQPIQLRFNELLAGTRGDVAVKVFGERFEDMVPTAERVAAVLSAVPGAADVKVEQTAGLPMLDVAVDRSAISRLGLDVADVQDVVSAAVGGREAGVVYEGDRRVPLVVRLPEDVRASLDAVRALPVPLHRREPDGHGSSVLATGDHDVSGDPPPFVPLSSVARLRLADGPNQVSRDDGKRRVVVTCNVRDRDLGSFVAEAQRRVEQQVTFPPGTYPAWGGQYQNLQAARARLAVVVPACFALILLLLYGSFGNVRDAVLVFTCVPLAVTGGVAALWLRGMPLSISAAVGFIALSGVAVLNGLVMVSHVNRLRRDGEPVDAAVVDGAVVRLRPVLMTALVASLGFVPMAVATGTGAEVQRPLATVVIGGLASATALTLLVLPALYRLAHRDAAGRATH